VSRLALCQTTLDCCCFFHCAGVTVGGGDVAVSVGVGVGVGDALADGDGLADGDAFTDGVGLVVLVGRELAVGLGAVVVCVGPRLEGCGEGVVLWAAVGDGTEGDGVRCCSVVPRTVSPVFLAPR